MPTLAITETQAALIRTLLAEHMPQAEVWLYGSRITGSARSTSDLDMVVFIDKTQRSRIAALKEAFEESHLPFRVDVFAWDELPPNFQEHIMAEHMTFVTSPVL